MRACFPKLNLITGKNKFYKQYIYIYILLMLFINFVRRLNNT